MTPELGSSATRPLRRRTAAVLDVLSDPTAVGERQLPFTIGFATSMTLSAFGAEADPNHWLWWGFALVVVIQAAGFLLPWRRLPAGTQAVLPLAQMVSLAMLEIGSGFTSTYYSALIFLPVVALALQARLVGVLLSGVGAFAVSELIAYAGDDDAHLELTRAILMPLTAMLVGLVVHSVTDRLRNRTAALQALREEQDATLAEVRAQRDQLEALSEQLRGASEVLAALIDSARLHAIIATGPDGAITVFSKGAETLLGYTADEAQADVGMAVIYDQDELRAALESRGLEWTRENRRAVVLGAARDGGTEVAEWTFHRRDGAEVPVEVVVTRRPPEPDGSPTGYLFVATDISERREAARLQDEFVGLVSHELRTPLTAILGYTDLMRLSPELTAEQGADLEVIDRNAKRLLRLVTDLLLSVQLSSGTFALVLEPVDLAELAKASVQAITPMAEAAEVDIVLDAPEPVRLTADPVRVGQVLENLLSNGIKFTPAKGTVTVRVHAGGTADARLGVVEVSDTGIGIGPDELGRLAERFYRAPTAKGKRIRGIGLGLSIVQAIMHAHHGRMDVTSALGKGTTFTVEFPEDPAV